MTQRTPFDSIAESSTYSTMRLWMENNRTDFAAAIAKTKRPNWGKIAATLASLSLLDGHGRTPTASTARQAWRAATAPARKRTPSVKPAKPAKPAKPHGTPSTGLPEAPAQPEPASRWAGLAALYKGK